MAPGRDGVIARAGRIYPTPVESFEVVVDPNGDGDVYTIADAVAAIPPGKGGTIYLRAGTHDISATINIVNKAIRIKGCAPLGSGNFQNTGISKIRVTASLSPVFQINETTLNYPAEPFTLEDVYVFQSLGGSTFISLDPASVVANASGPFVNMYGCVIAGGAKGFYRLIEGNNYCILTLKGTNIQLENVANQKFIAGATGTANLYYVLNMEKSSLSSGAGIGPNPLLDALGAGAGLSCSLFMGTGSTISLRGGEQFGNFVVRDSQVAGVAAYTSPVLVNSPQVSDSSINSIAIASFVPYGMTGAFVDCDFNGSFGVPFAIELDGASDIVSITGSTVRGTYTSGAFTRTVPTALFIKDQYAVFAVSADTVLDDRAPYTVLVDASGANRLITLPNPAKMLNRIVTVKKTDASANAVTVTPAAGTIDGAASVSITQQYRSLTFISDGTNWWLV